MAERRKIVIETGAEPSEPLPTPHFDTEATLTARPVVPLTDQETYRTNHGGYAARPAKPFWKRPVLLIPIILAAVGIGIAAGFAIGMYRNRNAVQPPVATAPAPTAESTDLSQTVEPPPAREEAVPEPEARASVPEETEETKETEKTADEPKVEERERTTARNERKNEDDENEARQAVVVKPPVAVREKKPIKVDEYEIEDVRAERQAERERRREERRERRRRQREDDISVPRGIDRGVREADRIREIFEGRQP